MPMHACVPTHSLTHSLTQATNNAALDAFAAAHLDIRLVGTTDPRTHCIAIGHPSLSPGACQAGRPNLNDESFGFASALTLAVMEVRVRVSVRVRVRVRVLAVMEVSDRHHIFTRAKQIR